MSTSRWFSHILRTCVFGSAAFLVVELAAAQSGVQSHASNAPAFSAATESSSLEMSEAALPANPAAAAAEPSDGSAGDGGQWSNWRHKLLSNYALEFGGGFNAPKSSSVTYGGNFTVGGGVNFSRRYAVLAEYQFITDKLPGSLISETGAQGGHAHIWSFTLDPVVSLFPRSTHDIYVTGGGGFYRKVTSFTDVTESMYCDYFYGCGYMPSNMVVGHFSSNQGGWNLGAGYQYRMGGMYHDSRMKIFIEARYVDVLTPAVTTQPNGLGTTTVAADTKIIPVTFGLRW